jgi:D-beta-D-heptose 7-phosphate kinase/D-beta-D-heptose 1-phosphate adenosyltransferase
MTVTVWTNGCFDILHRGHIELFKYAKSLGDYLVVGVDDDERVRASKGESRPINKLEDRMEMLQSIRYIDEVVSFDIDRELDTQILLSGASIIVVGSDYKNKKVIGQRHCTELKFFDRIGEYSTTNILLKKE